MSDDERGYREGRPLAEIIPPDRRRVKAAGLVIAGMLVGALLLVVVQGVVSSAKKTKEAQAPIIESFAAAAEHEDVTSPRSGPIAPDGSPDDEFELVVTGPVIGIVVAQHYPTGRPMPSATRWGTTDYEPASPERAGYGMPEVGHWQLSVSEGFHRMNDPLGGMMPLGEGKHRLVLHLSSGGAFTAGSNVRAYVIGPGNAIAVSDVVHVSGDWVGAKPLPTPYVPDPPPVPGPPFDRGAAAAALGGLRFDHCAKLAGAKETGRLEVTFAPDGTVTSAAVIEGVEPNTSAARCIAETVKQKARIPAFGGAPVHVKKSFTLPVQQ